MVFSYASEIVSAFQALEDSDPDWLQAIINRPAGSQWGRILESWSEIASLKWRRLALEERVDRLHLPQCIYYHHISTEDDSPPTGLDLRATENMKLLSEFEGDFSSIQLVDGAHGLELVSELVEPTPTREAWLIIGPKRGELYPPSVVWTAYPGRIAASVTKHKLWDGSLRCLQQIGQDCLPIAVKGLNRTK